MLGLRQKLSLGFGGLLLVMSVIGVQSIIQLRDLGESIDVILRENYRSVIACQEMKEALERIDSGVLFTLLGYTEKGTTLIRENRVSFEDALQVELSNVTLPGEGERAAHLDVLFKEYKFVLDKIENSDAPAEEKREAYFAGMLPLFQQIKVAADEILHLNQQNMSDANDQARGRAAAAQKQMVLLLTIGATVAVGFVFFAGQWILRPINSLAQSADEISRGNLDLVVRSNSRDEIGHLSEAFNTMAASLRQFRRANQAKLVRMQRAAQQAFDNLPEAVAVIDLEGKVEEATEAAERDFGLKPGISIRDLPSGSIVDAYEAALKGGGAASRGSGGKTFQHFRAGEEGYFRPEAVPILDDERQPTGVTLVIRDVTQLQQQDEIKRGVISTVSHQLKTPLTSIRMAIHLLLEEKIGSLTEKQAELLVAAREDSDRLHGILNSLLDISRMESGKVRMDCRAISPHSIVLDAVEPFRRAAQDQGVALVLDLPDDLPEVWADMTRITHAFGNLLSNALKYTAAGGKVSVAARADEDWVHFSISDTGRGIPAEHLPKIFEQFFRVPDQGAATGAGLGLAIVKEIVEAHGGTVHVASEEGQGSTFTLSLRRADRISKEVNAS